MIRHGYDETNGIVIGEIEKTGKLFYDNREQRKFYGKNDREIIAEGKKILDTIKQENGNLFKKIYPDEKWEVRIYD